MSFNGRTLYEAWAWEVKPAPAVPDWDALSESHRWAWEALARAIDRSPPIAQRVPAEAWARAAELSRAAYEQIIHYSPWVMGDPIIKKESLAAHHRSCAIRRGGNECTC